jgi:hypothetical protein
MGAASSFAEADKFACREWAIGYTSGSISPTEAYRNQIFREIECNVICRKSDVRSGLSAPCRKPPFVVVRGPAGSIDACTGVSYPGWCTARLAMPMACRQRRRNRSIVIVEPLIAFLPSLKSLTPKLFAKIFANERMGTQLPRILRIFPGKQSCSS